MNRKPQPADSWWKSHQASCNGTFIKVSEPEKVKSGEFKAEKSLASSNASFKGKGRTWSEAQENDSSSKITDFFKKPIPSPESASSEKMSILTCVNCTKYQTESLNELNEHLDICLQTKKIIDLTDS